MKKLILKFLINLAMIQTVLMSTAALVALQIPVPGSSGLAVFAFVYLIAAGLSLAPSVVASLIFAMADGEGNEEKKVA